MGFPEIRGYYFGGRRKKDCSILGSTLGSLVTGNYYKDTGARHFFYPVFVPLE